MLFNSFEYALFFGLVLFVYWRLDEHHSRLGLLFGASLLFYMSWNPPFVLLLLLSVVVDFFAENRNYFKDWGHFRNREARYRALAAAMVRDLRGQGAPPAGRRADRPRAR